jgi:two-component system sensor histidine kinase KdpD
VGLGTDTHPGNRSLYVPLRGSNAALGVIVIAPADVHHGMTPDAIRLLHAFMNHAALALERGQLAEVAERARVQSETERLRSGLLSSVSHDLRTPLAVITGIASTLLDADASLPAGERRDMLKTVADEANRLNRLVGNLLAMTRVESGALEVKRSWHPLEEIIGAALHRIGPLAGDRTITVEVAADLPLVGVDDVLIEQVVFNLIENALKHAASPTPIEVRVGVADGEVEVSIADRGPGIPIGAEEQIFDKFYRGKQSHRTGGVGLGLTIGRGIVEAHGGRIRASNRLGGGTQFVFTLPLSPDAPRVDMDAAPETQPQEGAAS